jgi:hypothetical protein
VLVLVIGGVAVSAVLVTRNLARDSSASGAGPSSGASSDPGVPHVGGVQSAATAVHPVHCSASCFDNDFLIPGDTVPPENALGPLNLPTTIDSLGDYDPTSPGEEYDGTLTTWQKNDGTPSACFFTYFQSPVVAELGARPDDDGSQITYTGTHSDTDKNNTVTQSVRLFANSDDAETYLQSLADAIDACPKYSTDDGTGAVESTLRRARDFADFPSSEAMVGWVETSPGGHYETIDIQRGNLVLRSSLQTYDDRVTDVQFHRFVDDEAWQIAAILTPGAAH